MQRNKLRRTMAVAILVPVAFLLSACGLKTNIDVLPDGMGNVSMDLELDSSWVGMAMGASGLNCEQISRELSASDQFRIEDLSTSSGLHCRFVSTEPVPMSEFGEFVDKSDTVELNLDKLAADIPPQLRDAASMGAALYDIDLTVNMPGKIISATGPGKVSGRTYHLETGAVKDLQDSIVIVSKKHPGVMDGFGSLLPWLAGLLVLLVAGGGWWYLRRQKRGTTAGEVSGGAVRGSSPTGPHVAPGSGPVVGTASPVTPAPGASDPGAPALRAPAPSAPAPGAPAAPAQPAIPPQPHPSKLGSFPQQGATYPQSSAQQPNYTAQPAVPQQWPPASAPFPAGQTGVGQPSQPAQVAQPGQVTPPALAAQPVQAAQPGPATHPGQAPQPAQPGQSYPGLAARPGQAYQGQLYTGQPYGGQPYTGPMGYPNAGQPNQPHPGQFDPDDEQQILQ